MPSFKNIQAKYETDFQKVIDQFKDNNTDREISEYIDEYNGKRDRRSTSVGKRQNKTIGEGDEKKVVEVAKLVFNFPKKIVRTAVAFLFGGEMSVTGTQQDDGLKEFRKKWQEELKMQSVIKDFARTVMVETKAALLFYPVIGDDKTAKLRTKLLNKDAGDFYPHLMIWEIWTPFFGNTSLRTSKGKRLNVSIFTPLSKSCICKRVIRDGCQNY